MEILFLPSLFIFLRSLALWGFAHNSGGIGLHATRTLELVLHIGQVPTVELHEHLSVKLGNIRHKVLNLAHVTSSRLLYIYRPVEPNPPEPREKFLSLHSLSYSSLDIFSTFISSNLTGII